MLNLDLVSEEEIQKLNLDFTSENAPRCFVNSDEGLLLLQTTLLETLRKYWLPRHFLHFVTTLSKVGKSMSTEDHAYLNRHGSHHGNFQNFVMSLRLAVDTVTRINR